MGGNANAVLRRLQRDFQLHRAKRGVRKAGLWFVDVPRTSSTSLKVELTRRFGPAYGKAKVLEAGFATDQVFPDHIPAARMRRILGRSTWDELFTFSFVRNPWDRILSLFHYRQKVGAIPDTWTFGEFVERLVEADGRTPYFQFYGSRFGAAAFVTDKRGRIIVDEVFKFEDREAGLARIAEVTGVSISNETRLQKAKPAGQHYREMYDDTHRDLIARRYARDIDLFDYTF